MNTNEVLRLALEALESSDKLINGSGNHFGLEGAMDGYYSGCFDVDGNNNLLNEAITALQEALAEQPAQQEFVDFASLLREAEEIVREKPTWKRFIDGTPLSNDIAVWMTVFAQDVARRTSPPAQRTWVGLTDEQIDHIAKNYALNNPTTPLHFARAIEAAHGIKENT